MHQLGLRSKYPELNGWPTYYKKANGVMIDNYLDMAYMGIKANILGYANKKINKAVKKAIDKGNMSSLNPIAEKKLAKKLLKMHPDMDIVRYARTGGEACKIAVDIAEEFKQNEIHTCGYHGWHIKQLQEYGNIDIEYNNWRLLKELEPTIFICETIRYEEPTKEWINTIKELQSQGMILILDEITSGFRFHCGGAYQLYGLEPDIVIYGKAISNGYPMAVIMGKENIMKQADDMWISSTYWTESIGPTAALVTIKELKGRRYEYLKERVDEYEAIIKGKFKDEIEVHRTKTLLHWEFKENHEQKKLNFCKYMLDNNILATDAFFPSFNHTYNHILTFRYILQGYVELINYMT